MYCPDLRKLWEFLKRNWPVVTAVIGALALVAVLATSTVTLQSCGCQGPTVTPVPSVTPIPTPVVTFAPTPVASPTPQPATGIVTDVHRLWWESVYGAGPIDLAWGWDSDGYVIAMDVDTEVVYTTTCTSTPVWHYVIDVEVRRGDGTVVRRTAMETGLSSMAAEEGTPMPRWGQYDGDLPWEVGLVGLTGELEVWGRGRWMPDCDRLPIYTTYDQLPNGFTPQDERGFSRVGVYER